jgi:hypothetical protein
MMEAARTSETSINNYFKRQYIPEDKSELQSCLLYATMVTMVTKLFNVGQKWPKVIAGFRYKGSMDIFELFNIKLSYISRMNWNYVKLD